MNFDIPLDIEQEIQQYAQAEHITADEAVVKLIHAGLTAQTSNSASLDEYPRAQAHRVRRGPRPPISTDDAESVIGMFAGKPDFLESVEAVIATRSQRYSGRQS